jgi:hypothetical protein
VSFILFIIIIIFIPRLHFSFVEARGARRPEWAGDEDEEDEFAERISVRGV